MAATSYFTASHGHRPGSGSLGQSMATMVIAPCSIGGGSSDAARRANPCQDAVKRLDHLADFGGADIERRHEAQRVRPRRVQQDAGVAGVVDNSGADVPLQIECLQQASAADAAETVARGQLLQLTAEQLAVAD